MIYQPEIEKRIGYAKEQDRGKTDTLFTDKLFSKNERRPAIILINTCA